MTRLRLHIRYRGTRVQPICNMRPPQIMRRQVPQACKHCRLGKQPVSPSESTVGVSAAHVAARPRDIEGKMYV